MQARRFWNALKNWRDFWRVFEGRAMDTVRLPRGSHEADLAGKFRQLVIAARSSS